MTAILSRISNPCLLAGATAAAGLLCLSAPPLAADPGEHIAAIKAVGKEGAGNEAAAEAWAALAKDESVSLVALLEGMDGANELASNWLRAAVDVAADRAEKAGKALPEAELNAFLADQSHGPRARELAFELLERADAEAAAKLVPGFLLDPANGLRRRAVRSLIDQAGEAREKTPEDAAALYQKALDGARDADQIKLIADALRDLKKPVDLPRHFGFIMDWQVVAPFDNKDRGGFDIAFPPEKGVDLNASYEGKDGDAIKWQPLVSEDDYGMLDFNKPYGLLKEVVGYAYTEFDSEEERPAEIRLGCKNAWKVWVNGELLFGRDEYHRGARIDQYKLPFQLKKGKNTILVKLCQNEQKEEWTVQWQFQLRVCDEVGTAILEKGR